MGGRGASSGNKPRPMGMGIGLDSRITDEGESLPSTPVPQQQRMTEAQLNESAARAEREMNARLDALRERDAAAERVAAAERAQAAAHAELVRRTTPVKPLVQAPPRQVVHYAPKPIPTQAQVNAQMHQRAASEMAFDQRMRARNEAARVAANERMAKPISVVSLPSITAAPKPGPVKAPGGRGFWDKLLGRGKK